MTHSNSRLVTLLARIRERRARVGVIGLGYVGLPLAVELACAGFHVTGFDVNTAKVREVNGGRSYIPDVDPAQLADAVAGGRLHATSEPSALADLDVIDMGSIVVLGDAPCPPLP